MITRKNIYYWKSDRPYFLGNARINDSEKDLGSIEQELGIFLSDFFQQQPFVLHRANGQGNHITFRASCNNTEYFIRIENGPELDTYMDVGAKVIREVKKTGVPCPSIVLSDSSRTKVSFAVQIMHFIDATDLNKLNGNLNLPSIAFDIGCNIAKWQSVKVSGFGLFDTKQLHAHDQLTGYHQHYQDYYFLNWETHLCFLQDACFLTAEKVNEIRDVTLTHIHLLQLNHGCLAHKDLALWNILGGENEIIAFIDWDDAIAGDPVDDLSLLACFHPGPVISAAIEGYKHQAGGLPENFINRFWLHLLRNMLFKAVIRIKGNYFDLDKSFFLTSNMANSQNLKHDTLRRIDLACKGLRGQTQIALI